MAKKKKEKPLPSSPVGRRFFLRRKEDESGVSGVGRVALGIQMPSGRVLLEWLTATSSEAFYNSIEECIAIHGHGGKTEVEWIDAMNLVTK